MNTKIAEEIVISIINREQDKNNDTRICPKQELDKYVIQVTVECMEEYASPLKKRIEELEAKQVKIFDPDKNNGWSFDYNLCSQIANNINQHENLCVGVEEVHEILLILKSLGILNPSTNGK